MTIRYGPAPAPRSALSQIPPKSFNISPLLTPLQKTWFWEEIATKIELPPVPCFCAGRTGDNARCPSEKLCQTCVNCHAKKPVVNSIFFTSRFRGDENTLHDLPTPCTQSSDNFRKTSAMDSSDSYEKQQRIAVRRRIRTRTAASGCQRR